MGFSIFCSSGFFLCFLLSFQFHRFFLNGLLSLISCLRNLPCCDSRRVGSSLLLGNPAVVHFLVFFGSSKSALPSFELVLLFNSLSSDSLFSDKSLNLRGFLSEGRIGIPLAFECSSDDVLLDEGSCVDSLSLGDVVEFSDL